MTGNPEFSFFSLSIHARLIHAFLFFALLVFVAATALFYLIYTPRPKNRIFNPTPAMLSAGVLSILRLPFAALPYVLKFVLYLTLRKKFKVVWNTYGFQALRLAGDFLNFSLTFLFLERTLPANVQPLLFCAALAECTRLTFEKGFILFSIIWQKLPVGQVSTLDYYALSTNQKLDWLQRAVFSAGEWDQRFRYFFTFKIIPASAQLRTGKVRGIARGEIFIHAPWLNDPWLCLGLCARRLPWIFDPRYLLRPFYYRSQANQLMTEFVFTHADCSPPFALYQFGHEIKSARFGLFFKAMRFCGWELEQYVQQDGVYLFDPFIHFAGAGLGIETRGENIPMQDESTVIDKSAQKIRQGQKLTPLSIAEEYSYPLAYVEEVLWHEIESAAERPGDDAS